MLGFGALGELALGEVPEGIVAVLSGGDGGSSKKRFGLEPVRKKWGPARVVEVKKLVVPPFKDPVKTPSRMIAIPPSLIDQRMIPKNLFETGQQIRKAQDDADIDDVLMYLDHIE
jgi:hypothetical protein